jgi:colanic acid/amylovoran biosynthesis glycosyltransferase
MGVPLDRFPFRPPQATQANEETTFVTVGSLAEHKGQTVAIEALARLSEETHPWHYHIVGDGPLEAELHHRVSELELESRVTTHGWTAIDEVRELLAESDILLHPARQSENGAVESQGVTLAEAQAIGLPVVASDCGGISDTVINEKTGYLVPPDDVDALHDGIKAMLEAKDRWGEMGRAGRAHVEANFSHERLMRELLDRYEELAAQYNS